MVENISTNNMIVHITIYFVEAGKLKINKVG